MLKRFNDPVYFGIGIILLIFLMIGGAYFGARPRTRVTLDDFDPTPSLPPMPSFPNASTLEATEETEDSAEVETLRGLVSEWHNDLYSDDAAVRRVTYLEMSAKKEDFETLFPEFADKLWQIDHYMQKRSLKAIDDLPAVAIDDILQRNGPVVAIRLTNCRTSDSTGMHAAALKMIPAEIPVYRAVVECVNVKNEQNSYVYVNGRWIFFRSFAEMPDLIAKIDQVLQNIERMKKQDPL